MKTLFIAIVSLFSVSAFAGIQSKICSNADGSVRWVSEAPGVQFLLIKQDAISDAEKISLKDVGIIESKIHMIEEEILEGLHTQIYSARLHIKNANLNIVTDAICEVSIY